MRLRTLALVSVLPLAIGCNESEITGPTPLPVTFTGTTDIRNGSTIPANARVFVLWGVSATTPDYSFVYGTGTITSAGAVSIKFSNDPPPAALNLDQAGVGLVIVTTDQTLEDGPVSNDYAYPGLIGMSVDQSIIFTQNLPASLASAWWGRFDGYGLGQVERSTTGFDSFRSVAVTSLKIVIDNPSNLHPPNWTSRTKLFPASRR